MAVIDLFVPDYYYQGITDIKPEELVKRGISLVLLDYDNTLFDVQRNTCPEMSALFIEACQKAGIAAAVVSNNFAFHSRAFARSHSFPVYAFSLKPMKRVYKKAMRDYACGPNRCAVIGDHLITDILGGNRAGMMTILIDPLSEKDNIFGKLHRVPERLLYKKLADEKKLMKGRYDKM